MKRVVEKVEAAPHRDSGRANVRKALGTSQVQFSGRRRAEPLAEIDNDRLVIARHKSLGKKT